MSADPPPLSMSASAAPPPARRPSRYAELMIRILLAVLTGLVIGVAGYLIGRSPSLPSGAADASGLGDRSELAFVTPTTVEGSHVTLTDSLRHVTQTVRIGPEDQGRSLDSTAVTCHGGRARVQWSTGNLEPTVIDTGITLTARFDGAPIGSLIRGSSRGDYNDAPAVIAAVVNCPAGMHVVDLLVTRLEGQWGIPYVSSATDPPSTDYHVNRGFIVEEIW